MAKFKTRARAVDLLGKQQIRDEVTAISELLRNSYDADASEGLIDIDTDKQSILVCDDGDGMSADDLEQNWLTIGTYSKKTKDIKPSKKNRIKIGEKGIGRLAVSLLGDQLIIISKKKLDGKWCVLYLHWELFRNEKLFLDDIEIPLKTFNTIDEVSFYLKENLLDLKKMLLINLEDDSRWENEVRELVIEQINSFQIENKAFNRMKIIESRKGGTIFYLKNIDSSWDWKLYEDIKNLQVQDETLKIRYRRLKDLLYSFQNYIDIYDKELEEEELITNIPLENEVKEDNSFYPKIHINGHSLEDEQWFNKDDIKLYDYALKGKIIDGMFIGKALMRGQGKIEEINVPARELTIGLSKNYKNFGPIYLKWFFVEGNQSVSSLNKDQHRDMKDKLEDIGGIYVYRDGLRILPYGEKGNDFLHMEERRSRRATTYLFSHRRMFGFMEISKISNPNLVDKSSREGFVENSSYNYFRNVAINLLKWWALEYLGTTQDEGKRNNYINALKEEHLRQEKARQQQLEEEKREKEYFKNLNKAIENFSDLLNDQSSKLLININTEFENYKSKIELSKNKLEKYDLIYSFKRESIEKMDLLQQFKLEVNPRYNHSIELVELIEEMNNECVNAVVINKQKLDYLINQLDLVPVLEESEDLSNINANLDEALGWIDIFIRKINELNKDYFKYHYELLDEVREKTVNLLINSTEENRKKINNEIEELAEYRKKFNQYKISNKTIFLNDTILQNAVQETLHDFNSNVNKIQEKILSYENEIKQSTILRNTELLLSKVIDNLDNINLINNDEFLIGLLKKEVEMYRDLSAVGLAAEMTSHEFNSLNKVIRENVDALSKALKPTPLAPVIQRVNQSFASLERLQARMSPLYRQSRKRSRDINIKLFIDDILEYFSTDIRKYTIKIINDIPEDLVVREIEPVLFTPIANVVSNSIYWMLNQDRREIHFYYSETTQTLFIHDTGQGIKESDMLRVFEPYFTKKLQGRGLGLFLSRDTLESRGHFLFLEDNNKTQRNLGGACFGIQFKKDSLLREV
ncbi:sensor histidine kinase [Paenibacillus sp. Y412MC10]|uniref:sensor histidine kinase n=1 Tax=Geobacillus sp. (strain Y412MC10) TaxID=481743 RepID=UPI0011AB7960|nr:sensor histidine kinase [Paenibacillus sp. Y412MC10]